ncbi:MAG: YqaA family protein [Roseinatronobacter sp.]
MIFLSALAGLFVAAFIAATIIPFQSEIVFVGLLLADLGPVITIIVVASIANTLGAFVNYALGAHLERYREHRWFPLKPDRLERARSFFERWGKWSLLLSWMPVIELTTVIAGTLRTPLWQFALLVGIAKTARYIVLAGLTLSAVQVVS